MAAYATREDLADYLKVDPARLQLEDSELVRLVERASEVVDYYTLDKARAHAPSDAVTKAVCAQIEHWLEAGEEIDVSGNLVRFYQIGSLRVDFMGPSQVAKAGGLSPRAYRILMQEGLLYRGVG